MLTLCGIFYSANFYQEFDIAILKLANVSDLLIAGLSEPAALLMFSGGLIVAFVADLTSQYLYRLRAQWETKPKSIRRTVITSLLYTPKRNDFAMLMTLGIFIIYANLFVSLFADWHSKQIKQGDGEKVMVQSKVLGSKAKKMTLLGSTTSFLLTYNPVDKQAVVIPIDNIDKLTAITETPAN